MCADCPTVHKQFAGPKVSAHSEKLKYLDKTASRFTSEPLWLQVDPFSAVCVKTKSTQYTVHMYSAQTCTEIDVPRMSGPMRPQILVVRMLLVVRSGAPSSFLFLVRMLLNLKSAAKHGRQRLRLLRRHARPHYVTLSVERPIVPAAVDGLQGCFVCLAKGTPPPSAELHLINAGPADSVLYHEKRRP